MSISPRVKGWVTAVLLGILASAVWDGVKVLWGIRVSVFAFSELVQVGYFFLIAGSGVYLGRRLPRRNCIFMAPHGPCVQAKGGKGTISLDIFSCYKTELLYVKAWASGTNGVAFTIESSDPTTISECFATSILLEKPITQDERSKLDGLTIVGVNGYAKFKGRQKVDFQFSTVPLR
jgi:hypothetical protein